MGTPKDNLFINTCICKNDLRYNHSCVMKHYIILQLTLLFIVNISFSQPHAFLLQNNSHSEWDTVCTFNQHELLITHTGDLLFQHSSCLPVSYSPNSVLYFIFPDKTYFQIETKTVMSSTNSQYPCIQVHQDSIRNQNYKVEISHLKDTMCWSIFVDKWCPKRENGFKSEKPILEIGSSYIVYNGDTLNQFDESHKKNGKWIIYKINNVIRTDSISFYLPYDVSVLVEQHFEHGEKNGSWTGYYNNGEKSFSCIFANDSMVNGVFYNQNGKIRYKFLYMEGESFVFRDYTNKRKKLSLHGEILMEWLRL